MPCSIIDVRFVLMERTRKNLLAAIKHALDILPKPEYVNWETGGVLVDIVSDYLGHGPVGASYDLDTLEFNGALGYGVVIDLNKWAVKS